MLNCVELKARVEESMLSNWQCEPVEGESPIFLVTTSALLPNNDCIELLVEIGHDNARISDNGTLYNFLLLSGIDIADRREKSRLKQIVKIIENYHVDFTKFELRRDVPLDELALGVELVIGAIKDSAYLVYTVKTVQKYEFKERVFALLAARQTQVNLDYPVTGHVIEHTFDIRLNGNGETLARTVSVRSSGAVQAAIERAWFAFDDVQKTGRTFEPSIVYDDSTPDYEKAWQDRHFDELVKLKISKYAFMGDKEALVRLAEQHRVKPTTRVS
jgi:hypothetical protein